MAKLTPQARLVVLKRIDELLELEKQGVNVEKQLQQCGELLGWTEKKEYRPPNVSERDYQKYLMVSKKNNIPARVYKDRLRSGKTPEEAATVPYVRKPHKEEQYLRLADQNKISRNTYHWRRRRGWSKLKAATHPVDNQERESEGTP